MYIYIYMYGNLPSIYPKCWHIYIPYMDPMGYRMRVILPHYQLFTVAVGFSIIAQRNDRLKQRPNRIENDERIDHQQGRNEIQFLVGGFSPPL